MNWNILLVMSYELTKIWLVVVSQRQELLQIYFLNSLTNVKQVKTL